MRSLLHSSSLLIQTKAIPPLGRPAEALQRSPQHSRARAQCQNHEEGASTSQSLPQFGRSGSSVCQEVSRNLLRRNMKRFPSQRSSSSTSQLLGSSAVTQTPASSFYAEGNGPRLRVAVDVDEVLGRFVYKLNHFCKEKYGMDYDVSDYWIYEFAKIWNCSGERSNHIVHDFLASQIFTEGIPVIPGAFEALERLSQDCDLVVVTSRQHIIQDVTLDWIDRHYQGLFQEVYFGNHFALEGVSRKKSDICRAVGAQVLIDDNPSYALECAANGIHVLLYDWDLDYPWSKLPEGKSDPLIKIVRNWEEAEQAVIELAPLLQQNRASW